MEKFPFTSEGAAALVASLYAMGDTALQAEALAAQTDFSAWLISHFDFDSSQVAYLSGMSSHLLGYMGAQVGMALWHRLPLTLVKPLSRGLVDSKLIETKSKIDADGDSEGEENAEGYVTVTISY